jgi:polysaccharide pyruvyl transferase WcaK-like protein
MDIKKSIKLLLTSANNPVLSALSLIGFFYPNKNSNGNILLIPPTDKGSLGDEAMLVSVISNLQKRFPKKDIFVASSGKSWSERLSKYDICISEVKAWSDFTLPDTLFSILFIIKKHHISSFYLLGADVMDGYYSIARSTMRLRLLKLAELFCRDVRLLGFSFNENPHPKAVQLFRLISGKVKILARDPVSLRRLIANNIQSELVADLAFALEPKVHKNSYYIENIERKIFEVKSNNKKVCFFNVNAIHSKEYGEQFTQGVKNFIEKIILHDNIFVVFVSHDERVFDGYTDIGEANKIVREIGYKVDANSTVVASECLDAAELKYLVKHADFTITGRMHFAISSLSQGKPTVMFDYQGKQEGLANHFNIGKSDIIISPALSTEEMVLRFDRFLQNITAIKNKIEENLINVQALSLKNIE